MPLFYVIFIDILCVTFIGRINNYYIADAVWKSSHSLAKSVKNDDNSEIYYMEEYWCNIRKFWVLGAENLSTFGWLKNKLILDRCV